MRLAGPDGMLVELDALVLDAPEHHAAQLAVAKRQTLPGPVAGRLVVAEGQVLTCHAKHRRHGRQGHENGKDA